MVGGNSRKITESLLRLAEKEETTMISGVTYKQLRIAACTYVVLPLAVFLMGFLKWYYALVGIAVVAFAFYSAIKSDNVESAFCNTMPLNKTTVLLVFFFTLVWTYFGGMNGYWYQSTDWNCRNPIYFDLIQFEWPVIYTESGGALVYYIGHWLPPALLGKLAMWVTGSFRWGRFIGRMALWGWTSLGLTIVILLLFHFLKVTDKKKRFFALLIFVCFSGLDILGAIHYDNLRDLLGRGTLHLEWWSPKYQFTSITACVYWVFNQTIIPWIVTLCFLMERDARNYVLYGVACLICGPFPCVGLAICMLIKAIGYCIDPYVGDSIGTKLKNVFSCSNILSVICVFPFVASYILSSNALNAVGVTAEQTGAGVPASFFSSMYWNADLAWFLLLEVGLYLALVFIDRRKDLMFYGIILVFVIAPYFRIGLSNDFCMRVSVPAVFILMLYVNDFLLKHFTLDRSRYTLANPQATVKHILALALAVCFLIGMATPAVEVLRGFYHVFANRTIRLEDMSIGTFNRPEVLFNFGCTEPENFFFFKYFAR